MRRSPRQRYPYFPGDPDPFIRPLHGFGPILGFGPQGAPPVPPPPPLPPQQDYYAELFDRLSQLASTIAGRTKGSGDRTIEGEVPPLMRKSTALAPDDAVPAVPLPDPSKPSYDPIEIPKPVRPRPPGAGYVSLSLDRRPSASPGRSDVGPPVSADGRFDPLAYLDWLSARKSESSGNSNATDEGVSLPADTGSQAPIYPGDGTLAGKSGSEESLLQLIQARRLRSPLLVSPTGRPVTLPEYFRWHVWINNLETLKRLDPGNRMLQNLYSPDWVPGERDLFELHNEILDQRTLRGLGEQVPGHHPLATKQGPWFERQPRGILMPERDLGVTFMERQDHVGRFGIHPWWERDLEKFKAKYPDATREEVYEQLQKLLHGYGIAREPK